MKLRTTIAVMALTAGLAAPSAGAMRIPLEPGLGQLVAPQHGTHVKPRTKQPILCKRYEVKASTICLAFGV